MELDFNFWMGVSGVFLTIVFGVLSIYYVKSKKYPGKIIFIEEQSIGLFDSLVKNFPQITIDYEGKKISEKIVLIKGCFLNTGTIDIKDSMVEKNLNILLPENCKWLNAKIVDGTKGNKFTLTQIGHNVLEINFSLFKKNEFLRFEGLTEILLDSNEYNDSPAYALSQEISFSHRIADTGSIEKQNIDLRLPIKNAKYFLKFFYPVIFLLLIFTMTFFSIKLIHEVKTKGQLHYLIKTPQNETFDATAQPQVDSTLQIIGIDKTYQKNVSLNEFYSKYVKKVKIGKIDDRIFFGLPVTYTIIALLLLTYILSGFLLIPRINQFLKFRKIKQIRTISGYKPRDKTY